MNFQPILENELVLLRPLTMDDFKALYQVAGDPLIWEQHPSNNRYQLEVFKQFFAEAIASKGALIIIDKASNEIIGSSRYQKLEDSDDAIEIGWSFLARKYWGGKYNAAVKSLMLQHAFNSVNDVVFYIGSNNTRSRKAVEKIGGELIEGPAYKHLLCKKEAAVTYLIRKSGWINTSSQQG